MRQVSKMVIVNKIDPTSIKDKIELLASEVYREKCVAAKAKNSGQPVRVKNIDDEFHMYIYGDIGYWGIEAVDVVAALAAADGKDVVVHINSYGGDVFEARSMAAALVSYDGNVRAVIDGFCASAATFICTHCETKMQDGSVFMIHNAASIVWGNHIDMRKTADILEEISDGIANDYVGKTGIKRDEIRQMMDDETYMNAKTALEKGFVDAIFNYKDADDDADEPDDDDGADDANDDAEVEAKKLADIKADGEKLENRYSAELYLIELGA